MTEITRSAVARVGVDLSKRVFQVHAVDRAGQRLMAGLGLVLPQSPDALRLMSADKRSDRISLWDVRSKMPTTGQTVGR